MVRLPSPASLGLVALSIGLIACLFGCVSVPKADPLEFAVDDDELREAWAIRELELVAAALERDPDLHLLIVGHADEDNTDDYNRALSLRRAEHVRDRLVALRPELGPRVAVEARGEWDASATGSDDDAKARNRRVELRYHYPRQCEPSFEVEFLACEWARLPEPTPPEPPPLAEAEPEPQPEPEAAPKPPPPRRLQDFRGPFVFGLGGYAIASSDYLRQFGRWGLGAGYLWGFDSDFRIALGLSFDHLIDVGFLFPQTGPCSPFCDRVDRGRVRVVPELRFGGARGGFWGWLRISAGLVMEHREPTLASEPGSSDPVEVSPGRWDPGAVFGIGPGVAITLTAHLFILFDATVTYARTPGVGVAAGDGGAGIYDVGAGLGWVF